MDSFHRISLYFVDTAHRLSMLFLSNVSEPKLTCGMLTGTLCFLTGPLLSDIASVEVSQEPKDLGLSGRDVLNALVS